jgi:AbrB family looped-hinge helix DNA binding protein
VRTTIDSVGRIVIPKSLRDQVGLRAGDVEVVVDGAGLHIEPVADGDLVEEDGHLVIPATGARVDDETVRRLRYADKK